MSSQRLQKSLNEHLKEPVLPPHYSHPTRSNGLFRTAGRPKWEKQPILSPFQAYFSHPAITYLSKTKSPSFLLFVILFVCHDEYNTTWNRSKKRLEDRNTLAIGYVIPNIRAYWGLPPVRQYSCRAYQKEKGRKPRGFLPFFIKVGITGLEPATSRPPDACATNCAKSRFASAKVRTYSDICKFYSTLFCLLSDLS